MTTNIDDKIAAANTVATDHFTPTMTRYHRFVFGPLSDTRAVLQDDEGEFVMEIAADAVSGGALIALNLLYDRGYRLGAYAGELRAKGDMVKALGLHEALEPVLDRISKLEERD